MYTKAVYILAAVYLTCMVNIKHILQSTLISLLYSSDSELFSTYDMTILISKLCIFHNVNVCHKCNVSRAGLVLKPKPKPQFSVKTEPKPKPKVGFEAALGNRRYGSQSE